VDMAEFTENQPNDASLPCLKNILIIFAMQAEAQPLIDHLQLTETTEAIKGPWPSKIFSGTHKECYVNVVLNGKDSRHNVDLVGTNAATLTTYLAIQAISPTLIINAGTAGGFRKKGAAVGDVFLSTAFRNHDRRIPIPGFLEWGIGHIDSFSTEQLQKDLGFKAGVVTTGNSLDYVARDLEIMAENDASVKDMEAAAIAAIADLFNIPFFALKVITDIVDGERPTEEEFLENLGVAASSLQQAVPKVIDYISTGNTLL